MTQAVIPKPKDWDTYTPIQKIKWVKENRVMVETPIATKQTTKGVDKLKAIAKANKTTKPIVSTNKATVEDATGKHDYPIYVCEHCEKEYKSLKYFRIHEANCNPDAKPRLLANSEMIVTRENWEFMLNALNLALEENAKVKRQLELAKYQLCKP